MRQEATREDDRRCMGMGKRNAYSAAQELGGMRQETTIEDDSRRGRGVGWGGGAQASGWGDQGREYSSSWDACARARGYSSSGSVERSPSGVCVLGGGAWVR
jgi:hypothetical protein